MTHNSRPALTVILCLVSFSRMWWFRAIGTNDHGGAGGDARDRTGIWPVG